MLKQLYNASAIQKSFRNGDARKLDFWEIANDPEGAAKYIESELDLSDYKISGLIPHNHGGKKTFFPSKPQDVLALRLVDKYLRRIYKTKLADRRTIIKQIEALLEDSGELSFIKVDIKSFYENIDFEKCLYRIKETMILSATGIKILSSLHHTLNTLPTPSRGLPRGINVSATLSEIYMEKFDKRIKNHSGVLYYARYVDDIFILMNQSGQESVQQTLEEELSTIGLELNSKKDNKRLNQDFTFQYLGYEFDKKIIENQSEIKLRISHNKVRKIKQRIYHSFLEHKNNGNFQLLLDRLRYLSCNKPIKKGKNGTLLAGNAYNYSEVTNTDCFKVFDRFVNALLNRAEFTNRFSPDEISKIKRVSFFRAVQSKKIATFTKVKISKIKTAWAYEN